ncbi:MAG: hypothetical protein QOJ39_599, partial [Candidatus Eremiobacteraeota bacterium]|nr:hypothetical protein [Candidatus Eremiobacteraeota bacterium]
ASLLAGCGGGSHANALPPAAAVPTTAPAGAPYTGPLADATFTITIPAPPKTSSTARRPAYVSSSTSKVVFTLNTASRLTAGQVTSFNASSLGTFAVTLGSAACPGAGPWTCTLAIKLPPGTDNLTIAAEDSASHVLSQQIATFTVVVATANNFSTVLDANLGVMTVNGSGSCQNGPVGAAFGSVGTTPITFNVAYTDQAGAAVRAPGLPKLEIQDNTATFQAASGTVNGTGGTVGFTINQAAQTFTLTPSNSTTTNASINVKAVPANSTGSSDGLAFSATKTFAFSTGVAPPSHNFLAVVEQTGASTGQVDFFNVNSTDQSSLSAFSPATLAVTNSTNEGKPDVDNPLSLAWDSTGDLLIGNSNDGGTNHGDLACVPVGAIATGANSSTTVSANVTVPEAIAYDSRDGSVALADNPVGATYQISEYLLTGNYTAAPPPRNLAVAGVGDNWVVNITAPGLSNGTYAAALTDGIELDPAHSPAGTHVSKIAIFSPNGTETDIVCGATVTVQCPTTYAIDDPTSLAWDAAANQLIIANGSIFHKQMAIYTIGGAGNAPTAVQTNVIAVPSKQFVVATSADGHIALQYNSPSGSGDPLVQVYNTAAGGRATVGGPIPYNNTTDAGTCANYVFGNGGGATVNSLTWLSNSKILIGIRDTDAGHTAENGMHIYDINNLTVPTGFDDKTCAAYSAAPTQTSLTTLSQNPRYAAFKP